MEKILITGSNGLLGQKLIEIYRKYPDHTVLATSRGINRIENLPKNVTYQALDITEPAQVKAVFEYYRPTVVINTAALTNVDECELNKEVCFKENVEAVKILVEESAKLNCFFVQLSTDFIFDGKKGPYDEKAKPNPISYYGESKLLAEKALQESKLNWSVIRTILVYGYSSVLSRSNIVLWVRENLLNAKEFTMVNDQYRTPTLAEDLAAGCFQIVENHKTGIYHLSGSEMMTPYEMAVATASFFKLNKKLIKKGDSKTFKQPAQRPPKTGFKIDKAKKEIGFKPRSFKEGLKLIATQIVN